MNKNEWIKKADDDLRMADIIIEGQNPPSWGVCYHCQQAVEKYLKTFLIEFGIEFREVHDLKYLWQLCFEADGSFEEIEQETKMLNPYSVTTRYPFISIKECTIEEAKKAIEKAKKVKDFIKARLAK